MSLHRSLPVYKFDCLNSSLCVCVWLCMDKASLMWSSVIPQRAGRFSRGGDPENNHRNSEERGGELTIPISHYSPLPPPNELQSAPPASSISTEGHHFISPLYHLLLWQRPRPDWPALRSWGKTSQNAITKIPLQTHSSKVQMILFIFKK